MPHPGLDAEFRQQLRQRRSGREHLFDTIDPASTALVVIDMQNVFVDRQSPLAVPAAAGIVAAINQLAAAARGAGATVVWVRSTFGPCGRSSWPLYFSGIAPGGGAEALRALFHAGSSSHGFCAELDVADVDPVVDKDRFSPFAAGSSDLDLRLLELQVDTLLIAGTLTNVCCESTMRDAMMCDYRCVLVADACAAKSDAEHVAALENAATYFGDVRGFHDVCRMLEAHRQPIR